jgi:hypothetical protein
MMPTIRVDDEVWAWLKRQAQPFEDTPNTVLRRVAGLDAGRANDDATPTPRMRRVGPRDEGAKTPQGEYREPILRVLLAHGGRADRTNVLKELEHRLRNRLTDFDRQDIKSGAIRWQKTAEWEVSTMRQRGLLLARDASPHGVWCLSPAGEQAARALPKE